MADESILARIQNSGGPAPRVRLKPLEADEDRPMGEVRPTHRYEVVGEIARGGVGVILRGHDADLGRDVALKVLREGHLESSEIVTRFVEEAQIGGQLQHPGIVPVYELGVREDRRPFFAMRLVKGKSLAEMLDARHEVGEERRRILAIFEQICQTVAYAHSRGVIHRDLKPSNVMIGSFGEVQVVDWGFAKLLARGGVADERRSRLAGADPTVIATLRTQGEGSESVAGSVMGTPAYMPPEQALGRVDDLDERADVFALGAILCEILTGKPPYLRERGDLLEQAARCDLEDAESRLESCGADSRMRELARACLRAVPKERLRNAGEVACAVAEHLATVERRAHAARLVAIEEKRRAMRARERAEEARERAERQRRARRGTLVLAAAAALLLVVAGGGWLWVERGRAERRQTAAAAVDEAMREALSLRGEGTAEELARAAGAAERAATLAVDGNVAEELAAEAKSLDARLHSRHATAVAREEREARHARLLTRLEEIRYARSDALDAVRADEDYVAVFREHGLDPAAPAAKAITELPEAVQVEVAAALDDWAWLRRSKAPREDRPSCPLVPLVDLARRLDSDPLRNRLRDAIATGRTDRLREMAMEAMEKLDALPVRTIDLLALGLHLADEPDGPMAADLLRRALVHHPSALWLHYHLSLILGDLRPPDLEGGIRHLEAALALRPASAQVRTYLGKLHQMRSDVEGAK